MMRSCSKLAVIIGALLLISEYAISYIHPSRFLWTLKCSSGNCPSRMSERDAENVLNSGTGTGTGNRLSLHELNDVQMLRGKIISVKK